MNYRRLGSSGLLVSELSFGAMTFGNSMPPISKVDQGLADRLIARCVDKGVNLFDTADSYSNGESEIMLGKALGDRRPKVLIATKVGFPRSGAPTDGGLSYAHVVRSAEASLRRLGTDWIDLYLAHRPDRYTPLEETLRAFEDLRRRGLIRYGGVSNMSAWQQAACIGVQRCNGWAPLQANQLYYSLLGRDIEHELVPCSLDQRVGIMVWSPLAAGYLTGRYTPADPAETGTDESGRYRQLAFPPIDVDRADEVVRRVRSVAARHGATTAQVALAWLLAKVHVSTVLVGCSTLEQLDDNLAASELSLGADEVDALDDATVRTPIYPESWAKYFIEAFRD